MKTGKDNKLDKKVQYTIGWETRVKYSGGFNNNHERRFDSYSDFLDHLISREVEYKHTGAYSFEIRTNEDGIYKIFQS